MLSRPLSNDCRPAPDNVDIVMMRDAFAAALLLACTAVPAGAASFDCARARTAAEKSICASPTLSASDEEIARLIGTLRALGAGDDLVQQQRDWLKSRDAAPAIELIGLHESRIAALKALQGEMAAPFDHAALGAACAPLPGTPADATCTVEASGPMSGGLFFQTQTYVEKGEDALKSTGAAVLEAIPGESGRDRLVAGLFILSGYANQPALLQNGHGRFLELSGSESGTGHFNAGRLLVETGEGWRLVDTTSWINAFDKRLPKGLGANKGIYPDYTAMTAETSLWKGEDANCCPTGGFARIRLGYAGRRITFLDMKVTPGEKAAAGDE